MEIKPWLLRFKQTRDIKGMLPEVIGNELLLKQLMQVVEREDPYPYTEYATWMLQHVCKKRAELLINYQPIMIDVVLRSRNESTRRNLMVCINLLPPSAYREGEMLDEMLRILSDPGHKVALHVHCLYYLIYTVKQYPELKSEILQLTDRLMRDGGSPALRVAIRNFSTKT